MPCICYGAVSVNEEFDNFLKSEQGKDVMTHLSKAAELIMSHDISIECDLRPFEFRQMFVKCLLHMLIGCNEKGLPKLN